MFVAHTPRRKSKMKPLMLLCLVTTMSLYATNVAASEFGVISTREAGGGSGSNSEGGGAGDNGGGTGEHGNNGDRPDRPVVEGPEIRGEHPGVLPVPEHSDPKPAAQPEVKPPANRDSKPAEPRNSPAAQGQGPSPKAIERHDRPDRDSDRNTRSKSDYKITPDSSSITPPRSLKEPLPGKALSVRDQAIGKATEAIAAARGVSKDKVVINSLHRINSRAHARGAFDVSIKTSTDPGRDAAAVAEALGPGFVTIHEKPSHDKKIQTNTTYFHDGRSITTTRVYGTPGYKAEGEHIHVQPNDVLQQADTAAGSNNRQGGSPRR
jgi:hypothetical protein